MPEFKLNKPHYRFKPRPRMRRDDLYDLSEDLTEWLLEHRVEYTTRTSQVARAKATYLYHYIDIPDRHHAMLFKLTWYNV